MLNRKRSHFKKNSILKALEIADSQIKTLIEFAKKNDYDVWIASSMGQDFIKREKYFLFNLNLSPFLA